MALPFLLIVSSVLCAPAWYVARQRRSWFWWDYATVFGPMLFWYALAVMQVGPQGLSNLIELLVVGAFVLVAVSCRVSCWTVSPTARCALRFWFAQCVSSCRWPCG